MSRSIQRDLADAIDILRSGSEHIPRFCPDLQDPESSHIVTEVELLALARRDFHDRAAQMLLAAGVRDPNQVVEVIQRFMVRIVEHKLADRFHPARGTTHAYLNGILRMIVRECLRQQFRAWNEAEGIEQEPGDFRIPNPVQQAEHNELLAIVRRWCAELPPRQQEAIYRRFPTLGGGQANEIPICPHEHQLQLVNLSRALTRLRQRADILS